MVRAGLLQLGRLRVTLAYGAMLLVVTSALSALDPDAQERIVERASTNLHNLAHGHVGTLLGSAFVVDAGAIALWLPNLLCLLALGELLWGSTRLVVVFLVGHVGATLLVAAGLVAAVKEGWTSTDITRATDVGMSYGAMAVLGALTAAIPRRWQPMWIGWWVGVGAAVIAADGDFTDAGHGLALVLGVLVGMRFGPPQTWNPWRLGLLAVASWFGFAMVVGSSDVVLTATSSGLLCALAGGLASRLNGGRSMAFGQDAVRRRTTRDPTPHPCR